MICNEGVSLQEANRRSHGTGIICFCDVSSSSDHGLFRHISLIAEVLTRQAVGAVFSFALSVLGWGAYRASWSL